MPDAAIHIVKVKPAGYPHAAAFEELGETLLGGFLELGMDARLVENALDPSAVNVVLGWHLLDPGQERGLPAQCILYNLEQMDERNAHLRQRLTRLAGRCEVWDYSLRNIGILHASGFPFPLQHVPIGMVASLTRIPKAPVQDIDVLFYGSVNERRLQVLRALQEAGLNVHAVFGVYGAARDGLISRAKVVLNLHFYESSIFELVRVSYLWANRKAVVAECHSGTELEIGLENAAKFVNYDEIVHACIELAGDSAKRSMFEANGYKIMLNRQEKDIIKAVLSGQAEFKPQMSIKS